MTLSHYCIWGLCKSSEYCCGDNVCCNESDFNPLVLTVVVLGILILLGLCSVCFYCIPRRSYVPVLKKYFRFNYIMMSSEKESNTDAVIT